MSEEINSRITPRSDLDFSLMTTNSVWGSSDISKELKDRVSQNYSDSEGNITKKHLWGLLNFYTRDMRLGNLSGRELIYCQYYINLAGDFLQEDLIEPFLISLSRSATILELSHSKKGFFRKIMNTFRQETSFEGEPPKKRIMGKGGKIEN